MSEHAIEELAGRVGRQGIADGPASPLFTPIDLQGNVAVDALAGSGLSDAGRRGLREMPVGDCICWGIPFQVKRVALARDAPVKLRWSPAKAPWLVFMHTSDVVWPQPNAQGFFPDPRGAGLLREHVADYVIVYSDGSEQRAPILRRHQIGMLSRGWGTNCFEAVAHQKPYPLRTVSEQPRQGAQWGWTQTRAAQPDAGDWIDWLWAWQNPHPEKEIAGLRIEPKTGTIVLSAVTAGAVASHPLRWETRRKAVLTLPSDTKFAPDLTWHGQLNQVQLDLGQAISAQPRTVYDNKEWSAGHNNKAPQTSATEVLVEYTAHPEARFHLAGGAMVTAGDVQRATEGSLTAVPSATQRVRLRVVEKGSSKPVAVKLHVHGEAGEYLAPVDRNRIPDPFWYEDWSCDYINPDSHYCTYIPGETTLDLPLGNVYIEISKGFEVAPVRRAEMITRSTTELNVELDRVLDWRARGWVTADTHVHFLSPPTAMLEGAGEGVNLVNLLASQWGELMTNVGDFDGKTTFGSREAGGDGEFLVRVGSENRQHVLGHISLLAYGGALIAPMTTGGPDESALGDPIEVLLIEWARQCRKQGGVVILPHFPNPRAEHAAAIVSGDIDGVEMTSWSNLYAGIDPYSLSDWYRYLNCGHFVAAVGGTDKMAATTAVGAVRTYAKLGASTVFGLESWKQAVRSGNTFVTYGPLVEFSVEGKPAGARIELKRAGGTLDVEYRVASVTVPMTRVELIANGVVRGSQAVGPRSAHGHFSIQVDRSSWIALLVRGHYADKPEMIAAHTSPVMVQVQGSEFFAGADALSILHQIEGALAYVDTVGTRAETTAYRRMRLALTSAHRGVHNRLHAHGVMHDHTPATDHPEHHGNGA